MTNCCSAGKGQRTRIVYNVDVMICFDEKKMVTRQLTQWYCDLNNIFPHSLF